MNTELVVVVVVTTEPHLFVYNISFCSLVVFKLLPSTRGRVKMTHFLVAANTSLVQLSFRTVVAVPLFHKPFVCRLPAIANVA